MTTTSADAQRWFDRGLNWCYGYHHEEAVACFEKALEADPDCAMAHWGVGYAAGPNYNFPWELMDPTSKAAALARSYDASRAALALVGGVTAAERALIEALPARYPQREPIEDQGAWNDAFADGMRIAYRAHPSDLDLCAIFVEAILNRTPWQMWDARTGKPTPGAGTLEAQDVLEAAFRDLPGAMDHPGLLHLHVHLMEMSPTRRWRWSPATGCANCARHGPPYAHADTYRHSVRPLPRRHALEPEGDRRGSQVLRSRWPDEFLLGISYPQLSLCCLWRDVPGAVRARYRRCR